ncbi:MAG: hypothetical protein AAF363_03140 [Bacteroidota bacterium]
MKLCTLFYLSSFLFILGCITCDDCGPVTSNPSVSVRFLQIDTTATQNIVVNQLNGQPVSSFDLIDDEPSSVFQFPVDLNADTTTFEIRYFLEEDTLRNTALNDTITVSYRRNTVQTQLRDVVLQIDSISVIENLSSYDSIVVNCFTPLCFQNETSVNVFF